MDAIERGSVYLTDDFVQSMLKSNAGQFSSFACIKLPAWNADGMLISSTVLGLQAGIVDPNVLLPEVFMRYWFNLLSYARQYHSTLNLGETIEDFSEQAFWKSIMRLMTTTTDLRNGDFVIAKSNDILVNTASYDGNAYLEVLLSAHAGLQGYDMTMQTYKPGYLSTINALATANSPLVIGGNDLALYDKGVTYYDISNDNCLVSKATTTVTSDTIEYNAILLYYTEGDVEQLAGIYFPDKFIQTDNGYELPTITKQPDVAKGYSLNFIFKTGGQYAYQAANADLGLAMQVYNKTYQSLVKANLDITALSTLVAKQAEQIENLQNLVITGPYATLNSEIATIKMLLQTKFDGTVSANKLLELFLAAKANTGTLNLTMQLADLSKSCLSKDITVSNAIGNVYQVGDVIQAGTSITEILANLLANQVAPTYTAPTASVLAYNQVKYFANYGTTPTIPMTVALTPNDSGGYTDTQVLVKENGLVTEIETQASWYFTTQPLHNRITFSLIAEYSAGAIKNYPDGTPCQLGQIFAGITRSECYVIPIYQAFVGSLSSIDHIHDVDFASMAQVNSNELEPIYSNPGNYQVLAIPADANNPIIGNIASYSVKTYGGITYNVYAVRGKSISIDTSNLR